MTGNKNNQMRNRMIKTHAITDVQKLAGLERFIHQEYPEVETVMQPYLLFTKGEDKYVGLHDSLSNPQVEKFNVCHCDMILIVHSLVKVFELDGPIHDIKTEKTDKRNKRYELNNIPYIVINETDLKYKLDIPKSRPLTQDQINKEFKERFDKL